MAQHILTYKDNALLKNGSLLIKDIPEFANAPFSLIKQLAQNGVIGDYWQVGDTKTFRGKYFNYTIRISDLQVGRYEVNGKPSHATFEFLAFERDTKSMGTTSGLTYDNTIVAQTLADPNEFVLECLPSELVALLEDTKIWIADTHDGSAFATTKQFTCKLFAPAIAEMIVQSSGSYLNLETKDKDGNTQLGAWDYYKTHTTASSRVKTENYLNRASAYWLRTPSVSEWSFGSITSSGLFQDYSGTICIAFAFAW